MNARSSPEFKVALYSAEAAYKHDQEVDIGDAPEIHGILVLQNSGLPRRPLVAVFAEFYQYQSPQERRSLGRSVERFLPGGDYHEHARTLRSIYGDKAVSWAKILLDKNTSTPRDGFSVEVKVFPKPEDRNPYDSLDRELKSAIHSSVVAKAIGGIDRVVYMTDPNYREQLIAHYAASSKDQNGWGMKEVSVDDFQRWTSEAGVDPKKKETKLVTWRSLRGKVGDRADDKFGTTDYRLAEFDLYQELESIKPDQVEEVVRGLASGESFGEEFSYTPALELAVNKWDQLDRSDKNTIFQWTKYYQPISPSDLVDRMAAPLEIRDYLMRQRIVGFSPRDPRIGLYIAYAELGRQMFVAGLR